MTKEEKKLEQLITQTEIPTGFQVGYKFGDKVMTLSELMLEMANDIKQIKKGLV